MKKILLLSAMAAVFLFGCKKDHTSPGTTAQKKYPVTFNMTDFTQTISSVSGKQQVNSLKVDSATANVAAYTTVLHLTIFDANGNVVKKLEQNSNVANYGVVSDSLAAGTYTVTVDAGQSLLKLNVGHPSSGLPTYATLATGVIYYLAPGQNGAGVNGASRINMGPWSDTFYGKLQFTVTNSPVDRPINMTRIVSKLEVDFNDVIPQNAARVDLFMSRDDFEYFIGSGSPALPDTITTRYIVPASVKGTSTYKISQLVLNTTTPFIVTLTAYDSANDIIAQHAVSNVTCQPNKRTILSGSFSNQAVNNNNGFTVSLDPSWGSPTTVRY